MTAPRQRPLLLLDVDGPLNPYAAQPERRPHGYATFRMRPPSWQASLAASRPYGRPRAAEYTKPLRVWLNPDHGPQLRALPFELVWATTWMHEANAFIAPELALPELPVIEWPSIDLHRQDPEGLHWKTRQVAAWAAGRPFAWVDDELTEADRAWIAAHHDQPALLHHVDPRRGLTEADFTALADWAERTAAP
ncbi:HAD domain-containing protein [Streptacidiphilus griseoplanus]|uniref:HAD domain-containing protein n=1 Tax=Peterkaempfera griseoplana TaxID=66896 RepID=UPI0006E2A133|nr:HAD domain-containing protein [Peterkaempfera griseoplana]